MHQKRFIESVAETRVQVGYEMEIKENERTKIDSFDCKPSTEHRLRLPTQESVRSLNFQEKPCTQEVEDAIVSRLSALPVFQQDGSAGEEVLRDFAGLGISYEARLEDRAEILTIPEQNQVTGTIDRTSYTFPFGMTLNLALEAMKRSTELDTFSWQLKKHERDDLRKRIGDAKRDGLAVELNDEECSDACRVVALEKLIELLLDRGSRKKQTSQFLIKDYLGEFFYRPSKLPVQFFDIVNALERLSGKCPECTFAIHSQSDIVYHTLCLFPMIGAPRAPTYLRRCPYCGKLFFPSHNNQKRCLFRNPVYPSLSCKEATLEIEPNEESKKRTYQRKLRSMITNYDKRTGNGLQIGGLVRDWGKEFREAHIEARRELEGDPLFYEHLVDFLKEYEKKDDYPGKRKRAQ